MGLKSKMHLYKEKSPSSHCPPAHTHTHKHRSYVSTQKDGSHLQEREPSLKNRHCHKLMLDFPISRTAKSTCLFFKSPSLYDFDSLQDQDHCSSHKGLLDHPGILIILGVLTIGGKLKKQV